MRLLCVFKNLIFRNSNAELFREVAKPVDIRCRAGVHGGRSRQDDISVQRAQRHISLLAVQSNSTIRHLSANSSISLQ